MTSYSYQTGYGVSFDGATGQITISSEFVTNPTVAVLSDDDSDDTFSPGDEIIINGMNSPGFMNTFIGYTDIGIIVASTLDGDSSAVTYVLLTTDSSLAPEDILSVTIDDFVVCFLSGTRIATPSGDRRIEELSAGDLVLTADGETRPVLWIGHRTVASMFADPLRSYPIRIAAGALGPQQPQRDLSVSPDHALLIDGLLVQAGALVNGTTIARIERPEARFTYFHIELADHAVILAEGVPAETFVDNVTRRRFDNYAEYETLHGADDAGIPELDLPRIKSARQLPPALRARLARHVGEPGAADRAA